MEQISDGRPMTEIANAESRECQESGVMGAESRECQESGVMGAESQK